MAAQYEPKEPAAIADTLWRPKVPNQVVHLKMANEAETCNLCVYVYSKEKTRRDLHVDRKVYQKPDLHSATGCCNLVV
jgi:hypothetical protein